MQLRRIQWDFDAWEEYCDWQRVNKAALKKINQLIRDILRDPFDGLGKPEPLKEDLSGFWSRRIDEENRLIYAVEQDVVVLISCKGHYE
jgi:toxin YoeB